MDPIYEYIKGQGWVLSAGYDTYITVMKCGTRVRYEARPPNKGEVYSWTSNNDFEEFQSNGKPKLEAFANHYKSYHFKELACWSDSYACDVPNRIWVTIVKLD